MASRLKLARAGAAVAGASVALMMTAAIPAGAEPASGKVDSSGSIGGYNVDVGKGHKDEITSLIGFELADGTKLQMYCVEINTRINGKHGMNEQPWDSYPNAESPFNANRDKINWVLHHGYPVQSTDAISKVLTEQGAKLTDGIDKKEAISATQAAVWHFSDNTALNEKNPFPESKGPESSKADVVALYKYLTGAANVGIGDQPTPALAVSPTDASGTAGQKVGPFTVSTTGDIEKLTTELPEGVKLVDANGVELTADTIENGTQLFLDVPAGAAEGAGKFELTATAGVDTGRLFVSENYAEKPTQSLIVATSEATEIVASAGGKWAVTTPPTSETTTTPPATTETTAPTTETTTSPAAPAPQPKNTSGDLAETGASILAPVIIGVVLVGAGVGSLLFLRRRKRA
jgi:TQXA domain-containing protein/LPXTG-motif cell wall-anchored protein